MQPELDPKKEVHDVLGPPYISRYLTLEIMFRIYFVCTIHLRLFFYSYAIRILQQYFDAAQLQLVGQELMACHDSASNLRFEQGENSKAQGKLLEAKFSFHV